MEDLEMQNLKNSFNLAMIDLLSYANNPEYEFNYSNYDLVKKTFENFEAVLKVEKYNAPTEE